jgi:hypothetical protein
LLHLKKSRHTSYAMHGSRWRIVIWGTAAFLLLLPLIAMQFTNEVNWDDTDFVVFGAMLFGACGVYELAARMTPSFAYRAAVGVAVMAAFILIWMNLAVGIIGSEDNPANLMYGGVLAVAITGASSCASVPMAWRGCWWRQRLLRSWWASSPWSQNWAPPGKTGQGSSSS